MSNHTGRLVLATADPRVAPDSDSVRAVLAQAGFIGPPLGGREGAFTVGPELLGLLSFTGCSVALPGSSSDQTEDAPCHVRILGPDPVPRLLWGRNTRGPRCPVCRARLADWRERLPDWLQRPLVGLSCASCGGTHPPWRWDWKQQGGFGRLFVLVEEVFPGEAVPTERLFDLLTRACGSSWRHFYVQD